MKALLLSITAGQGHNATANAVAACFESMGVECRTVDTYEYASPLLKEMVDKGYLVSTAYIPKVWGRVYRFSNRKIKAASTFSATNLLNQILTHELADYIQGYAPDIIVCTHPFAAAIVDVMKRKYNIQAVTAGIITDFTVHPYWEETSNIDYYITASEYMAPQLVRKNLDPKKMLPFGIPIHPKFSVKQDKKEMRRKLNLEEDKLTILIMSGSMGFGKIDRSIQKLDELDLDFQALVVCGKNRQMLEKILDMDLKKDFRIFGYVDNVDEMMDASDCIVTKPGGITSSEALAKELPMVMVNPIPGQEELNVEFLLNNQLAMYATKTYPLDEAILTLLQGEYHLENLRRNIRLNCKKDSSKKCCEFLMERAKERFPEE